MRLSCNPNEFLFPRYDKAGVNRYMLFKGCTLAHYTTRIRRCKMKNTVAESHEILLPHVVAWIKKDCLTSSINDWILGLHVHVDVYMYVPVPGAAPS